MQHSFFIVIPPWPLLLILQTLFFVDWHAKCRESDKLVHHYDFAVALSQRMRRDGLRLARTLGEADLETEGFVEGDVAFVSLNWDPLGLWAQFVTNRNLNKSPSVTQVGDPARKLQTFHDLGHFVPGPASTSVMRAATCGSP